MKKKQQLGMHPGTAAHRLLRDILFRYIEAAGEVCFHCKKPMIRDNFSIEHKEPWLDSLDPVAMYFDPKNIAFSHMKCNYAAARTVNKIYEVYKEGQKIRDARRVRPYSSKRRREQYERTGK
jgi:hypothetical protein